MGRHTAIFVAALAFVALAHFPPSSRPSAWAGKPASDPSPVQSTAAVVPGKPAPAPAASKRLTIVAVYAHPDDGEFFAGGTLAKWAAAGHRVVAVCATELHRGKIQQNKNEEVIRQGPEPAPNPEINEILPVEISFSQSTEKDSANEKTTENKENGNTIECRKKIFFPRNESGDVDIAVFVKHDSMAKERSTSSPQIRFLHAITEPVIVIITGHKTVRT